MNKQIRDLILISLFFPGSVYATGMAVGLPNLYLHNNTKQSKIVTVDNIGESGITVEVQRHSICRLKGPIMFQPFASESNNFVVMVGDGTNTDPVVIDKLGLLTLAHDSVLGFSYQGSVKHYRLMGFCGNKLGQYRFINVNTNSTGDGLPTFALVNCGNTSSFVYSFNDNYTKVKNRLKKINFTKIKDCAVVNSKL